MNRLDKIKQEFLAQFTDKLKEEKVDISVESAFDILVSADPSRNKKNVRWLMEIYLDDGYLWEDISAGKHSKVHETLRVFMKHCRKLEPVDRSINRYESIADMWKIVKQYAEDKSGHQVKREEYDKAMAESKIVIDNDDIRMVNPLTEYASKFHGRGTRWCTAADNNNQFWNYAKHAPLFIITLKESGDKLQLWIYDDHMQFMDADDKTVEKEYIEQNWNLLKDIIKDINKFSLVPEKHRTPELCKWACEQNGEALEYVSDKLKTPELCKLACEQNGEALRWVPDELITSELCETACKQNGASLSYVPYELRTYELCQVAVLSQNQTSGALQYVPNKYKTPELCMLAVEKYGSALQYVPKQFLTSELCEIAVKQSGYALTRVPEEYKTPELCEMAIKRNGYLLKFVPYKYKTYELCKMALKEYCDNTNNNDYYDHYENYKSHVFNAVLKYIPGDRLTPEMCSMALKKDKHVLKHIKDKHVLKHIIYRKMRLYLNYVNWLLRKMVMH